MPFLTVREPGRVCFSLPLSSELHIGRDAQADLPLSDRQASRKHAALLRDGSVWTIADLGSRHGTRVNGAGIERQPLRDGDRIQVGNTLLVYSEEAPLDEVLDTRSTDVEPPAAETREGRRLRLFHEAARAVAAPGDAEALLERMLAAVGEALACDVGLAALLAGGGGSPRRVLWRRGERGAAAKDEPILGRALLDALLVRSEAVVLRGVLAAPLRSRGKTLGFLYVATAGARADRSFTGDELEVLVALANLTAAALDGAERVRRAEGSEQQRREERRGHELLGDSPPMQRLRAEVARFAGVGDSAVHIRGETGAGKEVAARAIHAASPRGDEPFVAVNCAAIPDTMIESELFGHARGAFTGAARDHRGKFALAHRGTLFLDEVGDLSAAAQAKVLRVLEDGEVQPLGTERPTLVDVRVISATHKRLADEVAAGRFREDLYWRLAVVELEVPPLRARGDDILSLAERFRERAAQRLGRAVVGFTPEALQRLVGYAWPGNVRELTNEVERAVIVADGALIEIGDLSPRVRNVTAGAAETPARTLAQQFADLDRIERRLVEEGMRAAQGNVSEAARLLGISRIMMRRRLERFETPDGEE